MSRRNSLLLFIVPIILYRPLAAAIDKRAFLEERRQQAGSQSIRSSLVSNEFIEMEVSSIGEFSIGTVEGDPSRDSDDNKDLLFGHAFPSTSETLVRINGVTSSIHGAGTLSAGTDSITFQNTVSGIEITQTLTIVKNPGTLTKDTVRIYFSLRNTTGATASVALRTQMDTLLGSNDGAPFRVPTHGKITKDKEFDNDALSLSTPAIPTYALVFDDPQNPGILAQLTFLGGGFQSPDRVVLGYWPVAIGNWDYTIVPTRDFLDNNDDGTITGSSPDSDSSVIVWWGYPDTDAISLPPGQTTEMAIYYGMANCSTEASSPLNVIVCSPTEMTGSISGSTFRYEPDPLTISAFFANSSAAAVDGARAIMSLTPGLSLDTGQIANRPIEETSGTGTVPVNGTSQIDWDITTTARYLGHRPFAIRVSAGGGYSVVRNVFLYGIPNAVYGQATDTSGAPISGGTVSIYKNSTLRGTVTTQTDGTYALGGLEAGSYRVLLQWSGGSSSSDAVVTDSTTGVFTGNPTGFAAAADGSHYAYPNPTRDGIAHIAIYTDSAKHAEITIFDAAGREVDSLSFDAPSAGWHTADWRVNDRANGLYHYLIEAGGDVKKGTIAVLKRGL